MQKLPITSKEFTPIQYVNNNDIHCKIQYTTSYTSKIHRIQQQNLHQENFVVNSCLLTTNVDQVWGNGVKLSLTTPSHNLSSGLVWSEGDLSFAHVNWYHWSHGYISKSLLQSKKLSHWSVRDVKLLWIINAF